MSDLFVTTDCVYSITFYSCVVSNGSKIKEAMCNAEGLVDDVVTYKYLINKIFCGGGNIDF